MAGLNLEEREFMCMPIRNQNLILYKNQLLTMELIRGYKFYQKLSAVIGGCLAVGMGILFKLHLVI
jgi:hypothetical protein